MSTPGTGRAAPVGGPITELVHLTDTPTLAVRRWDGPLRPVLLLPDAGGTAEVWDAVANLLAAAGHAVLAIDPRGHGRSAVPTGGYDTDTAADDLATLIRDLGLTGARSPVVVGIGWGGNVAMSLAARRGGVAAIAGVDGGWLRPAWQYPDLAEYRAARPPFGGAREQVDTEMLESIARSLFTGDPRAWYPLVDVPVLLCASVAAEGLPDSGGRSTATRTEVAEATARLPHSRVSWYPGSEAAPLRQPVRLAEDLVALAATADPVGAHP